MPAAFIEVLIPIQESERSCIRVLGVMYMCVRDVDFVSVAMIFLLAFRIVPTQWCFFSSLLLCMSAYSLFVLGIYPNNVFFRLFISGPSWP